MTQAQGSVFPTVKDPSRGSWSRYYTIIISIALFLVFDMGVLVLNFYISHQIKDDAVAVNLAGRQRMLSQRTVKSLLQYRDGRLAGDPGVADTAWRELRSTVALFDSTFNAFRDGGVVRGAGGRDTPVAAVDTAQGRDILSAATKLWTPYLELLQPVLANPVGDPSRLDALIDYATANNLALLKLMNDLTNNLEGIAAQKASRLRLIQTVGIALALINFGLILFHFLRKLHESDRVGEAYAARLEEVNRSLEATTRDLSRAQRQTDEILGTVGEGLFLISADGAIADQHSAELARMFPSRQLAGTPLLALLEPMVSSKVHGMVRDYLTLLFRPSVKEKMLLNVNPLDEVELQVEQGDGTVKTRHFSFTFNRVVEDGEIRDALVTVSDVTQKVMLARELEASESRAKEQMEMLFNLIHLPTEDLQLFLDQTEQRLQRINSLLRGVTPETDLKTLADVVFRDVHAIKGEAAAIGFELFRDASHELEDRLAELRARPQVMGEDFVPSTLGLDVLFGHVGNTRDLIGRFAKLGDSLQRPAANAAAQQADAQPNLAGGLERLVGTLSSDLAKPLQIDAQGFDPHLVPAGFHADVKDILIQLVRNSATHGIEHPDQRLASGKPATGTITLCSERRADGVTITVKDDGRGLDLEAIRDRAVERGLIAPSEAEDYDSRSLAGLIFKPGFSTETAAGMHAGRGVGMDMVRELVGRIGGRMRVRFARGKSFELSVLLPESLA